jgi:hypothetical protein
MTRIEEWVGMASRRTASPWCLGRAGRPVTPGGERGSDGLSSSPATVPITTPTSRRNRPSLPQPARAASPLWPPHDRRAPGRLRSGGRPPCDASANDAGVPREGARGSAAPAPSFGTGPPARTSLPRRPRRPPLHSSRLCHALSHSHLAERGQGAHSRTGSGRIVLRW